LLFLAIVQSVISQILQSTTRCRRGEGVSNRGLCGNLTPLGSGITIRSVDGKATFVELLAIAEDVFGYLSEIDIEVAAILRGIRLLVTVDEWVHHPKLDVLDIGRLEIVSIKFSHHASPMSRGVIEQSCGGEVRVEVVWSALIGIESEVHDGQHGRCSGVAALVTIGINLTYRHLAHVWIAQLIEVTLDVSGRQAAATACEQRVDGVPSHLRTVVAGGESGAVLALGKHRRHARQDPAGRSHDIDLVGGILEIVDIRGIVLHPTVLSSDELRELAGERYA